MEKKKYHFEMQINSILDTDNPTKKEVEFILHDFDISHNYAFITKETSMKSFDTLKDTPIVCKYYPVTESGNKDDALGSHEMYLTKSRENDDEELVAMDTVPIGVFTEPAYIKTIEVNGEEKEVVAGKGVLWSSRFPNVIGLLKEWVDKGIPVTSSMEILYDSYKVDNGITEILSFLYEGHCILQSEDTPEHRKVYPAYDVSILTKLVAQAMNQQEEKEEGEIMTTFRKVFELSHSDIRALLYKAFDETLPEGTYSYISEVYEDHFIVNEYNSEGDTDKYFKVDYAKEGDSVSVNTETKAEVFLKRDWVEITTQEVQTQLNELTVEKEALEVKVTEFETSLNEVKTEKEAIETQFNSASETIVQLNTVIEELKPIQEQYVQEQFEKALNEKKEYYSAKFEAVGASEQYETEDVQTLLSSSVVEGDEGKEAILQLNTMLVELVTKEVLPSIETPTLRELSSKRENLLPSNDSFESRYK